MDCKTKKLKLRKYKYGSKLPKKDGLLGSSYLQDTTDIFAPQQQYDSLSNYNQSQNTQEFGPGLNAQSGDFIQSDVNSNNGSDGTSINLNSGTAGIIGSAAQIAASFVGDQSSNPQYGNYDSVAADTMSNVGVIGQVAGAVGEVGGSLLKPDYNEYGVAANESTEQLYYQAGAYFDPLGAAQNQDSFGEGVVAALLPGWGGENVRKNEAAEAQERERQAKIAANESRLQQINRDVTNYNSIFKYGGKLKKKQNGGELTSLVPKTPAIQVSPVLIGERNYNTNPGYTAVEQAQYNRLTSNQAKNILKSEGISLDQLTYDKLPEGLDPNVYSPYKDSTGEPSLRMRVTNPNTRQVDPTPQMTKRLELYPYTKKYGGNLDYMNPSNNNRPTVFKYTGQTHNGADEGIEVDATGVPSIMSGKAPVALTEKGEVAFKGPDMESAYIFSDSIKYKK